MCGFLEQQVYQAAAGDENPSGLGERLTR